MFAFLIGGWLRASKMTFRLSRDPGPFYLVVPHHLGLYSPAGSSELSLSHMHSSPGEEGKGRK